MFLHCNSWSSFKLRVHGEREVAGEGWKIWSLSLGDLFQISVLVLRWVIVETPIPVAGHGATVTEGFLSAGRGGMVVRCYGMEIKVRMDQTSLFILLLTCISQSAPTFSQAGIEGAVVNIWHLTRVKVLRWEKLEGACLWEVKEMGEGFSTSCVWRGMTGMMGEQLGQPASVCPPDISGQAIGK